MPSAEAIYTEELILGLRPDPLLTVTEWADENRILSKKSAAEPGQWRTSRTPYLAGVMDALSPSDPCEQVIFWKGTQLGGTECGTNWLGYIIDQAPGPIMIVQPNLDLARRYSKQRIDDLLEETPCLAGKVKDHRERDSDNTQYLKEFKGGIIVVSGANSAPSFRSTPVRYMFMDEIDAYPGDVGKEGDPVSLLEKRTITFARKKILKVSTGKLKGFSRIESAYNQSNKFRYHVPCPHCHAKQWLQWGQVKPDEKNPRVVRYQCIACNEMIDEHFKTGMMAAGVWIAEAPGAAEGRVKGFHLSSLYSPAGWLSWAQIVDENLKAKEAQAEGDDTLMKVWTNTILAETWEESGETISEHALYQRREVYPAPVPMEALLIVAGVDIQDDRIEAEAIAYGKGEQSWGVERITFHGPTEEQTVWDDLDAWSQTEWKHESGMKLGIAAMFVDSGFRTDMVYNFCKPREGRRIYAVKGLQYSGRPSLGVGNRNNRFKAKMYPLGVDTGKERIYARLKVATVGPGYCHFPWEYEEEFFDQLTSEKIHIKRVRGRPTRVFELMKGRRNEALDIRVYAYAALLMLRPKWDRLAEIIERHIEKNKLTKKPPDPVDPVPKPPKFATQGRPKLGNNWTKGWRR